MAMLISMCFFRSKYTCGVAFRSWYACYKDINVSEKKFRSKYTYDVACYKDIHVFEKKFRSKYTYGVAFRSWYLLLKTF